MFHHGTEQRKWNQSCKLLYYEMLNKCYDTKLVHLINPIVTRLLCCCFPDDVKIFEWVSMLCNNTSSYKGSGGSGKIKKGIKEEYSFAGNMITVLIVICNYNFWFAFHSLIHHIFLWNNFRGEIWIVRCLCLSPRSTAVVWLLPPVSSKLSAKYEEMQ